MEALIGASKACRAREVKSMRMKFVAAANALATAMGELDIDEKFSRPIKADLDVLARGDRRGRLTMVIVRPPVGSVPFRDYISTVTSAYRSLRRPKEAFVAANLRLVVTIARRCQTTTNIPLQDLVQEGNIGLMLAVERFDGTRGFKFSTYATWWIRHTINRALDNKSRVVRLPTHLIATLKKLHRAEVKIRTLTGESPTAEQLAKETGIPEAKVRRLSEIKFDGSLSSDIEFYDGATRDIFETIVDEQISDPGQRMDSEVIIASVRKAMHDRLSPIEMDIIQHRFGIDVDDDVPTLRQLGAKHALSRERIRQLQDRAMTKMRRQLASQGLNPAG
jgi:RNA polymerase primary sigma factor